MHYFNIRQDPLSIAFIRKFPCESHFGLLTSFGALIITQRLFGFITSMGKLDQPGEETYLTFAGPRVIEPTIRQKLPEGFQRSEYLLEHGMVDMIVSRQEMKAKLSQVLRVFTKQAPVS